VEPKENFGTAGAGALSELPPKEKVAFESLAESFSAVGCDPNEKVGFESFVTDLERLSPLSPRLRF
jgi:hypothetical protein